jgi:hypothetical protein
MMTTSCFGRDIEPHTNLFEMKKSNPIVSWDTLDVTNAEVEHRQENWENFYEDYASCPSEDEIRNDVNSDYDIFQIHHDEMTYDLTELMNSLNPDSDSWDAEVHGFGWRNLDGTAKIEVEDGSELLSRILPDCDCTYYVYVYQNEDGRIGLAINNYHHDSPMGEWYYVYPA